jgi:N-acetylneuraminic acid mutarotase
MSLPPPPLRAETVAASGTWTASGDLPVAGFWGQPADAAVLLKDGRVLLTGGEDGRRTPFASAALFAPTTGTWTAAATMSTPRRLHTTTRLADGRVLVAGGIAGPPATPSTGVASAEIYDPAANTWTPVGAMLEPRFSHSATLLPNNKVLVAGGSAARSPESNRALRGAELFDPATGQWTASPPMAEGRFGHPAVSLKDGRVLVVGGAMTIGRGQYAALGFCEIYDATANAWTTTGSLGSARKAHQATLLADGSVLVCGGDIAGVNIGWSFYPYSQSSFERFDPAAGTWSTLGDMSWGRSHHRAHLLGSGKVLVLGGTDNGTFDIGFQNAGLYDPTAKTWTETAGMVAGRWAPATVTLSDGRVLVAGGITLSGAAAPVLGEDVVTASTEIFAP